MSTQPDNKVIEITVGPAGEAVVQTRGFAGASCQDASRILEAALGEVLSDHRTPEFYQSQSASQPLTQQR